MKKLFSLLPIFLFFVLTIFVFRSYVFSGKVPFAGNLLVSFYQPWKSYPFPGYPNGPANKPIGFDSLRIFYPLRALTTDSLKKLQLPLWNPYDFAGNTQLATYQSAVFFPLTPLFLFLPPVDSWSLIVMFGPFFACLFMYYFLRSLGQSKKASVIGAITFGFSGTLLVLAEESFMAVYSILFLPLILLGIKKFFQEKRAMWFGCIVVGITFSILSGWFQSTLYALAFSFVWTLFLTWQTKSYKTFLWVMGGYVVAFLLSAPHIVPNLESYMYSARGTTDAKFLFNTYLVAPWHIITYIVPDFFGNPATYSYFGTGFYYEKVVYVGIVGFFLGLIELFSFKKTAYSAFFAVSWLVTLSLGVSLPTSWFFLYYLHIPLLSTILPSRIFILSSFSLAVLAAYGWEHIEKGQFKKTTALLGFFIMLVFISLWYFVLYTHRTNPLNELGRISLNNLYIPTALTVATLFVAFLIFIKSKLTAKIQFYSFLCIMIVSIFLFTSKYFYFSERRFVYPNTPVISALSKYIGANRFWSIGPGYIDRNFATFYKLQSPEGYDSFYIKRYGEFVEATKNKGEYHSNVIRADAQFVTVGKLSEIRDNVYLTKALNLLGVKYIVAKKSSENELFASQDSQKQFKLTWTDGTYTIFENTQAFPRAFLASSYRVTPYPKQTFSYLFDNTTNLRSTVILDKKPTIPSSDTQPDGNVAIFSYENERVVIQVTTNKDALLFLSDNVYPGWRAYVDGKATEILTADYTFRSVVVPKGKHTVIFAYQPNSVVIGFLLCGVGLLLFGLLSFTITKRRKV